MSRYLRIRFFDVKQKMTGHFFCLPLLNDYVYVSTLKYIDAWIFFDDRKNINCFQYV